MPQGAGQARDAAVCVCPSVCSLGGPGALEAAPRGGGQGASDRVREGVGGFTAGECVQSREGQAGQEGRAGWAGARPESASTVWGPRAGQRCLWSPRGKQQEAEGRRLRGCPTAAPRPGHSGRRAAPGRQGRLRRRLSLGRERVAGVQAGGAPPRGSRRASGAGGTAEGSRHARVRRLPTAGPVCFSPRVLTPRRGALSSQGSHPQMSRRRLGFTGRKNVCPPELAAARGGGAARGFR